MKELSGLRKDCKESKTQRSFKSILERANNRSDKAEKQIQQFLWKALEESPQIERERTKTSLMREEMLI